MVMAAGLRRALKGLSEAAFRERFGTEEAWSYDRNWVIA
jgi:hypothetical protein